MDFFNLYATNPARENAGTPHKMGDATLLIARIGNPVYNRLLAAAYEDNKAILDDQSSDAAKELRRVTNDNLMIDVMAQSILLGWTGNVSYQGKPLDYSVTNAKLLLALPEVKKIVAGVADDYRNFRVAVEAEDTENLSDTSSGNSSGGQASSS